MVLMSKNIELGLGVCVDLDLEPGQHGGLPRLRPTPVAQ